MSPNVLLWFKNDLRLHDNEALNNAIDSGRKVLPVFIFDTNIYRKLDLGFPKTDRVRLEFTRQCVDDLRRNLIAIGGNLLVLTGQPETLIPHLVKKFNCEAVFAEQEFGTEELKQIERIGETLPNECEFRFVWGRTLYHLDDLPFTISEIPLTSKTFRIKTTKTATVRHTFPTPEQIAIVDFQEEQWGALPTPRELGFKGKNNFALTFMEGGETNALERLNFYLFETEQLTNYRWTRNRSLGMDYSSKFSPYMALGCLSPRKIYEAVECYEREIKKNQSTWWIIFEIVWRDYFTFKLMRFQNRVYQTKGYTDKIIDFTDDKKLFNRWCTGQTGIPFVDAHMRQLNETGFMSNRGRVNCSSFLVHDYLIDWTWGAAFFESKLIDYDVASNWMNWHAQAYQIWYTNPIHQANKYKSQQFIRKWIPEIQHLNDTDILIPWESDVPDYPKPHKLHQKWTRSINKIKN